MFIQKKDTRVNVFRTPICQQHLHTSQDMIPKNIINTLFPLLLSLLMLVFCCFAVEALWCWHLTDVGQRCRQTLLGPRWAFKLDWGLCIINEQRFLRPVPFIASNIGFASSLHSSLPVNFAREGEMQDFVKIPNSFCLLKVFVSFYNYLFLSPINYFYCKKIFL